MALKPDEPRTRSVIDTLKLANRLSSAGMDRRQAEVLAEELNEQLRGEVATRSDLDALFRRVMAGVAALLVGHLAAVWGIVAAHVGG